MLRWFRILDLIEDDPLASHDLTVHRDKFLLLLLAKLGLDDNSVPGDILVGGHGLYELGVAGDDNVFVLLGQRDHLAALPPRRRRFLHDRSLFVVHYHVSFQLPILFKLFTARLTNFC